MEFDINDITITTSYFHLIKYTPTPISISFSIPKWASKFSPIFFGKLAPSYELVKKYKNKQINIDEYTTQYNRECLSRWKEPIDLVKELHRKYGNIITLLCWERPGEFCHRRLVADYIYNGTGLIVNEYDQFENNDGIEIKSRGS